MTKNGLEITTTQLKNKHSTIRPNWAKERLKLYQKNNRE